MYIVITTIIIIIFLLKLGVRPLTVDITLSSRIYAEKQTLR
jgi:hypothetical protein